jgi:hypothetical protein
MFYIGSSSIEVVEKGYHGSVRSKKYIDEWKRANREGLLKTYVLLTFETREEALLVEIYLQKLYKVDKSEFFINGKIDSHKNPYARVGEDHPGHLSLGKSKSPEHCENISKARTGIPLSPEHRASISAGGMGRTPTPETCAKLSKAGKGKTHTLEARANMSKSQIGKAKSPEQCVNMSKAKKGKKLKTSAKENIEWHWINGKKEWL